MTTADYFVCRICNLQHNYGSVVRLLLDFVYIEAGLGTSAFVPSRQFSPKAESNDNFTYEYCLYSRVSEGSETTFNGKI